MRVPASIRNKNPGAMEYGFAAKRMGSTTYEPLKWRDGKGVLRINQCATFPTAHHGAAAIFILLLEGKYYRNKSIKDAISTWCGGYSASEYVDHMCASTGLKPTSILTAERVKDPDIAVPIARAIARFERGRDFPEQLTVEEWYEAHAMAFGGQVAPTPTPDNDVPMPKPEAREREIKTAIVKTVIGTGAAGTAAVSVPVPTVPVPPDLAPVAAWKSWGSEVGTIVAWGWGNPYLVGGCAAAVAAIWFGPALLRRFT